MTELLIENAQSEEELTDEIIDTVKRVCEFTLKYEECNFDAQISITFTNNGSIHTINREYRNIDAPTDVLSFPMLEFDADGNILQDECEYDCGKLVLGDIVINLERAKAQAEEYGHSIIRETAFLTAHSMLHLLGYDHVEDEEGERIMIHKQNEILDGLGITRF